MALTVRFVARVGRGRVMEVIRGFGTQLSVPDMYSARVVNGSLLT